MATQSRGTCHFCNSDYAKGGMVRHLRACSEREAAIRAANGDGTAETLYHLRAEDEWGRPFWLDLEMRGSASLEELDRYLRSSSLRDADPRISRSSQKGRPHSSSARRWYSVSEASAPLAD